MGHPVRALKVQKAASLPQAASPFPGLYWAGARANIPAPGGTSSMLQQSGVQGSDGLGALSGHTLGGMPEEKRPDIRPQLRDFLAWYEEVLGRIESGAIVAPGEQERLTEEASAVAHLLDLLDSRAERARQLDAGATAEENGLSGRI